MFEARSFHYAIYQWSVYRPTSWPISVLYAFAEFDQPEHLYVVCVSRCADCISHHISDFVKSLLLVVFHSLLLFIKDRRTQFLRQLGRQTVVSLLKSFIIHC